MNKLNSFKLLICSTILTSPSILAEPNTSPLQPYFDVGCVVHGVDDFRRNDSRFFCLSSTGFNWTLAPGRADYEGLDFNSNGHYYDSNTNYLYASAGDDARAPHVKGNILKIDPGYPIADCNPFVADDLGPVTAVHADGRVRTMEEVDGITFDIDGDMLGWAQESGFFKVPNANLGHEGNIPTDGNEWLVDQPAEIEDVEDLGACIVGLLNIDHWGQAEDGDGEQHPNHPATIEDVSAEIVESEDGTFVGLVNYVLACDDNLLEETPPCAAEIGDALNTYNAKEIEAIEGLPPLGPPWHTDKVMIGFHSDSLPAGDGVYPGLVLGVLNLPDCTLRFQEVYDIPYEDKHNNLDVEGLALVCPTPQ
ncbi:hypothetical protein QUF74_01100 [Candidatus Halobeggiatoa sp. HSG11]|nr:hypothetical protein [Candidatus Halobeggiatoa sp. HSG11]